MALFRCGAGSSITSLTAIKDGVLPNNANVDLTTTANVGDLYLVVITTGQNDTPVRVSFTGATVLTNDLPYTDVDSSVPAFGNVLLIQATSATINMTDNYSNSSVGYSVSKIS